MSWFFQLKSFAMHVWMTVFFAALLGMEIDLLVIMSTPTAAASASLLKASKSYMTC